MREPALTGVFFARINALSVFCVRQTKKGHKLQKNKCLDKLFITEIHGLVSPFPAAVFPGSETFPLKVVISGTYLRNNFTVSHEQCERTQSPKAFLSLDNAGSLARAFSPRGSYSEGSRDIFTAALSARRLIGKPLFADIKQHIVFSLNCLKSMRESYDSQHSRVLHALLGSFFF